MNYLIISSFYRLTNKIINDFVSNNSELIKMDCNVNTIDEIIAEAEYESLFGEKKNILVYNCTLFNSNKVDEEKTNKLISYLEKSNYNNKLFFILTDPVDNRKKAVKVIKEKGKIIDYSKIRFYDLIKLVNDYLNEKNYIINDEIINYMIKNFNNNYDLICNEIDKLMLAFPSNVTLEQSKKIISNNISDNIFKFLDELINKNYKKADYLLKNLKTYKVDPSMILSIIYREFRLIFLYKFATKNNIRIDQIFKDEFLMDWQINKIADNSRKFKIEELSNIIKLLSEYDYKLKSGKIDKNIIIELFLIEIKRT